MSKVVERRGGGEQCSSTRWNIPYIIKCKLKMKEYTTMTLYPDNITGTCLFYTEAMKRLNNMARQGWEVINMVNVEGNKGEYLVLLSRNVSQNVQMLND